MIGDGETPETFTDPCGLTSKGFTRTANLNDTNVPDCDDAELPAWLGRDVVSYQGAISGNGVVAQESLVVWEDWWLTAEVRNVRIQLGNDQTWMMRAKLQEYAITADRGEKVNMSVSIVSDGALQSIPVGGVIHLSNSTVVSSAAIGSLVGTLSVVGGSGTYVYSLTSNPGGLFAIAGSSLNVAAALSAGSKPITISASNGVDPPITYNATITVTVAATVPANTVLPVISGTAAVGQTLTTTNGTWTGTPTPTYARQWKRGGVNISGATGTSYLLVSADAGAVITVTVTATNTAGSASATSDPTAAVIAAPVNSVLPAITGTPTVGQTLTATDGTWSGSPTFTRQWKRNGANIAGATASTYLLVTADANAIITVTVTATNIAGSTNATSNPTASVLGVPTNSVLPVISGSATQGSTLTTTSGTWSGSPTFAYQWKSAGANVGTNSTTYATVVGDVGNTITVVVTATNAAGSANATSAAFGPVTAIGSVTVRVVAIGGDSNSVGRGVLVRDPILDQDMTGVWQWINNSATAGYRTFSADITGLYHPENWTTDRCGPGEELGRQLKTRYPSDIIVLVPCGFGGQSLTGAGAAWSAPTGVQYLAMLDTINRVITAIPTQWPGSTIVREMVYFDLGANDVASGLGGATFHAAQKNLITTFRSSGMPSWSAVRWVLAGLPYDDIPVPTGQAVERAHLQTVAEVANVYYVKSIDDLPDDGDNIHRSVPANRDMGAKAAVVDTTTAVPVWPAATAIYNAIYNVLEVNFAGDFAAVGTEASSVIPIDASFEVGNVYALNRTLRFLGNGTKTTGGSLVPALTIIGGNRVTAAPSITVTTVMPDTVDLGTIIGPTMYGFSFDPAQRTTARQSQDDAGSTAVVLDGVVGRVVDSSNNAMVLTQATAANKPLLKQDGTIWNWQGDGINDILYGLTPSGKHFGVNLKFTVVVLLNGPVNSINRVAVGEASSSAGIPAFYHVVRTNDGDNITFQTRSDSSGGTSNSAVVENVLDGTWKVVSIQYNGNSQASQIRIDGGDWVTQPTTVTTVGPFSTDRLGLFGNPGNTINSWFSGQLGGVWGIADYAPKGMLAVAEQAYALRAGITLPGGPAAIGAPSLDLITASDTGSSTSDNITSDTTPDLDITFAQLPVAGDTVTIKDGSTVIATHTITALEAGSSTIDLALSALPEGAHSLTASHSGGGAPGTFSAPLSITIDTTAPTITSSASPSVLENVALNHSLTANEAVTWTKTGGADAASFSLSGSTLTLAAKDYEADPHSFAVQVTATDPAGNATTQNITVSITDVLTEGTATREAFTAAHPVYGAMFYAATNTGNRQSNTGAVFVAEA
jgi:hypothetical protein